ncbi:MAG: hypothetical protein MUP11_10735 [Anaerolineales bacterium]|nr:hypothetical protein [Anaerolineales bacterium]
MTTRFLWEEILPHPHLEKSFPDLIIPDEMILFYADYIGKTPQWTIMVCPCKDPVDLDPSLITYSPLLG